MASLTPQEAAAHLEEAIGSAELALPLATGGHPLFAAIESARQVLAWVQANANIIPAANLTRVIGEIDGATGELYGVMGTLRNDPDNIPATIWPQIKALPWPWIAAGVGGLLVVGILYQHRSRA